MAAMKFVFGPERVLRCKYSAVRNQVDYAVGKLASNAEFAVKSSKRIATDQIHTTFALAEQ